jgi:predicted alpha/beta superfamily hydrolase
MSLVPSETPLRTTYFTVEPSRSMRPEGSGWEYEIRVALPVSYAECERRYPVLWITDNNLEAALVALGSAELILVSVGAGLVSLGEASSRRLYDLKPGESYYFEGPAGEYLRRELEAQLPEAASYRGGGASRFLDFLVDDVRPALAAEYRMDPADHALFGFSAGGTFVCTALLARPDAFTRYICGSPSLYSGDHKVFELEERYAEEHHDLAARVFFAAGEAEITEPMSSAWGFVSGMVRLAEILSFRSYPSLRLTVKILPGESHETMLLPLLSWGVRTVWEEP